MSFQSGNVKMQGKKSKTRWYIGLAVAVLVIIAGVLFGILYIKPKYFDTKTSTTPSTTGTTTTTGPPTGITGRYVKLQNAADMELHIAELEVYADGKAGNVALGKTTSSSNGAAPDK